MARYYTQRRFRKRYGWRSRRGLLGYNRMSRKVLRNDEAFARGQLSMGFTPNKHFPRTTLKNVYQSPYPFPTSQIVRQTYSEAFTFNVGTTGTFGTEKAFVLNAMYDPDYGTGGHQPYGRDTLAAIYDRYKVLGVFIDVTFYGPSSNTFATAVKLSPEDQLGNTLQGQTVSAVMENNNTVVKFISSAGSQKNRYKAYFPMHKLLQVSKLQFKADIDNYDAPVGSNPSKSAYLRMAVADSNLGSTGTVAGAISLTFVTYWHERKQLAQS